MMGVEEILKYLNRSLKQGLANLADGFSRKRTAISYVGIEIDI